MQEALFCQALGLSAPWAVERVALDVQRKRIDLYVVWQAKSAPCPACSAACAWANPPIARTQSTRAIERNFRNV